MNKIKNIEAAQALGIIQIAHVIILFNDPLEQPR